MKYPCAFNIGQVRDKIWCAYLGKKSVPAQLVPETLCAGCPIRLNKTVNVSSLLHGIDYSGCKHLVSHGCCAEKICSILPDTICNRCELHSKRFDDISVVSTLFNITDARLRAFEETRFENTILVCGVRDDEPVPQHATHVVRLNKRQRYFLKEELFKWFLRNHCPATKYTAFIDADVRLTDVAWTFKAKKLLESGYEFVHLFETATYGDTTVNSSLKRGGKTCPGLAWMAKTGDWLPILASFAPLGNGDGKMLARMRNRSKIYLPGGKAEHVDDGVPYADKRYSYRNNLSCKVKDDMFQIADNGLPEFVVESFLRDKIECLN